MTKQLLYIPTGQYFKFFPVPNHKEEKTPSWSVERYLNHIHENFSTSTSMEDLINRILAKQYASFLYTNQ